MNNLKILDKLYGETQFLELSGDALSSLSVKEIVSKTQTYVLKYKRLIDQMLTILSEEERVVYTAIANLGWKNPPFTYSTIADINFSARRKEEGIISTEQNIESLISLGYIVAGTAEPQVNPRTLDLIKISLTYVGYRVRDPLISLYYYYESNKQLPHWLKDWLQSSSPKVTLNNHEQELISRIPQSGYIMAPTSRKLTKVREKWYWVTSEKNMKSPDAGLEQIMYILGDKEQDTSENLLNRNLLSIHSYHYGMPIYIPNPDYF